MGAGDDGPASGTAKKEWGLLYVFASVALVAEHFESDVLRYMVEDRELSCQPSVVEIMIGGQEGGTRLTAGGIRLRCCYASNSGSFKPTMEGNTRLLVL